MIWLFVVHPQGRISFAVHLHSWNQIFIFFLHEKIWILSQLIERTPNPVSAHFAIAFCFLGNFVLEFVFSNCLSRNRVWKRLWGWRTTTIMITCCTCTVLHFIFCLSIAMSWEKHFFDFAEERKRNRNMCLVLGQPFLNFGLMFKQTNQSGTCFFYGLEDTRRSFLFFCNIMRKPRQATLLKRHKTWLYLLWNTIASSQLRVQELQTLHKWTGFRGNSLIYNDKPFFPSSIMLLLSWEKDNQDTTSLELSFLITIDTILKPSWGNTWSFFFQFATSLVLMCWVTSALRGVLFGLTHKVLLFEPKWSLWLTMRLKN
jgi:hypothetical protein